MSERGLILALQRIHDDPGFTDRIAQDTESSLGLYDLDEDECRTLIQAVTTKDNKTIRSMASRVGIDWKADHIGGLGALDDAEVSGETGIKGSPALPGDGYEGVMPTRISGA